MNEKKIIFFDIDGTLVDSETHVIPQSTVDALQKLHEQGHTLCIATGRSLISVIESEFHKLITWDIYICNNGQAIYGLNQQLINVVPIPIEAVHACIDKAEQLQSPLMIMGETNRLTRNADENVMVSAEFFKETIPPVLPYDDSFVIMMIVYGDKGYDYHEYKEIEHLDIIPGQSAYADVVLKGFNKFIGIQYVLEYLGKEEYLAFGDSLNDMEMLEHATIGIAMGNAHINLKSIANFITDDVLGNGIYNALKKLALLS